jgi:putative hydrolase of the HAD superfamily
MPQRLEAVIFDLGNTLVSYTTREAWPGVLEQCIAEARVCPHTRGLLDASPDEIAERTQAERGPTEDHRVVPLEERLVRVFGLEDAELGADVIPAMCRAFVQPVFARAFRYDDVLPSLLTLRERGVKTGVLSNTAWGSPEVLWREDMARRGLLDAVDAVAFCREAGFRKPAPQPFRLIMERLVVDADQSIFVGDDPDCDIRGARAMGLHAVLIDRTGRNPDAIHDLRPVLRQVGA